MLVHVSLLPQGLECLLPQSGSGGGSHEMRTPPSRHLWLGNLSICLTVAGVRTLLETHGPVDSVTVFPGRPYAFANFCRVEDAKRSAHMLNDQVVPAISGKGRCEAGALKPTVDGWIGGRVLSVA